MGKVTSYLTATLLCITKEPVITRSDRIIYVQIIYWYVLFLLFLSYSLHSSVIVNKTSPCNEINIPVETSYVPVVYAVTGSRIKSYAS